ncbi:unnamed protein product [Angiostrongylus costaricensis]|uniref:Kinesin motor domain-containing protein n=1 Tax=Angiostrongylus costaricensis TaxID=334426 RepID=A0A0R3Q2K6_ANGCS|nr:unnamed protein product [Angiostrongylus costaricensis]
MITVTHALSSLQRGLGGDIVRVIGVAGCLAEADGLDVRRDVGCGVERHVLPEVVPEVTGPEEAATFQIVVPGLKEQFVKCRY